MTSSSPWATPGWRLGLRPAVALVLGGIADPEHHQALVEQVRAVERAQELGVGLRQRPADPLLGRRDVFGVGRASQAQQPRGQTRLGGTKAIEEQGLAGPCAGAARDGRTAARAG